MNKFKHLANLDYVALQYKYAERPIFDFVCMIKIVIANEHFLLCKYN